MSKVRDYLKLVKFEHSIFALPFVLIAAFVHAQGWPSVEKLFWIVVAAVSARTAAMAFNRIVDRETDALNPRTRSRELPTGRISLPSAWALMLTAAGLFILAAAMLNWLCLALSPLALVVLLGYSYTKQFTAWCHGALGLALGIAPVGAWIAIEPTIDLPPLVLSLAVICWVAGFDIIYALLDEEFDRHTGIHSAVVALGRRNALRLSSALHVAFVAFVGLFAWLTGMSTGLPVALTAVGVVLIVEHSIVSPQDLSRVNAAFFTANGVASLILLAGVSADIFVR